MANWDYIRFLSRYLVLVAFKRQTLGKTLEAAAARHGGSLCCLFESERITYAQFNERVNRRANLLRSEGVARGDVVSLLMENRPAFLETVAALAKLGAVAALINTQLRGQALAHCFETSAAPRAVVGAECLGALNEVLPGLERLKPEGIWVDTHWPVDAEPPAGSRALNPLLADMPAVNPPRPAINSKDLVMYIFTSGTTGLPKAARINHYRWVGAGLAFGLFGFGARREDVIYCPLPLYHSNGILIAFSSALVSGASLALARRFSASRFWEDAYAFGATAVIYIGEILRYLVNAPPAAHERDHRITRVLGNGLRPDIWETFRQRFGIAHVREFYASTEGNAYTLNMNDAVGSVGQAILKLSENTVMAHYDVAKDEHPRGPDGFLRECAPGETGELLARVALLTPFYGYTGRAETEKKLLRNVFRRGDVYFRTGDLMMKDAEGNYYFVDRIGDTFRWKGENVSTHEVQEILSGFHGLDMVGAYGVTVPGREGRAGMAALTMEADHAFDPAAFFRFTEEKLAAYMRPAFVRLIREAQLTGTFKLKKVELQEVGYDPARTGDPLFYRDQGEGSFLPLDAAAHERIRAGQVDF